MIIIEKRHLQYSRNSRCAEGLLQISSRWCWNELVIYGVEVNKNSQIIRFCNRLYPGKLSLTVSIQILISAYQRLMRFLSEKLNIPTRATMSAGQCGILYLYTAHLPLKNCADPVNRFVYLSVLLIDSFPMANDEKNLTLSICFIPSRRRWETEWARFFPSVKWISVDLCLDAATLSGPWELPT